jgi:hypothetical protein
MEAPSPVASRRRDALEGYPLAFERMDLYVLDVSAIDTGREDSGDVDMPEICCRNWAAMSAVAGLIGVRGLCGAVGRGKGEKEARVWTAGGLQYSLGDCFGAMLDGAMYV